MAFIEQYFTSVGISISFEKSLDALTQSYVIRLPNSKNYGSLNWHSLEEEEKILESIKEKLKSVLSNGNTFVENVTYDAYRLAAFTNTYFLILSPTQKLDSIL